MVGTREASTLEHARINSGASLAEPIQLIRTDTGQPCKAFYLADVDGMSPAYLVTDSHGKQSWVRVADTVVSDPRFLSASPEALKEISSTIGKSF